ncbi:methyltransferase domain-containing protein [Spongiibacter sp. KMU-166]|uniref:Methyltransferase domain-containing protein n=1 Tax=Spongiibacter thalassae TaxID=2721624 RepID=A0ABX1GIY2_9GAMM|nr:class I SAM-dependent methyltransferase [Spongiibacter thalassae]NKI19202.1 methyltransferase domain-containing protein [Spongiibacter thalassae]
MHSESMFNMQAFYSRFLQPHLDQITAPATVVDIGAKNVNGSYREVFDQEKFHYIGVDLEPGKGVDIVTDNPYHYPVPDNCADIVLSGQMLEHCEFFWLAFQEMVRIAKPGAYIVVIVPSTGFIHRFPVDCYRFLPDAMPALARFGNCRLIDSWLDEDSEWGDLTGVFLKPPLAPKNTEPQHNTHPLQHRGRHYLEFLQGDLRARQSDAHLEIGTRDGSSIAALDCPVIAIDPNLVVNGNVIGNKPQCLFFQMTSDDFFNRYRPDALFGKPIDSAFLDGMHLFEFLLRDFINTEKHCDKEAVIYMHDCLPVTTEMTNRDERSVPNTGPFAHWWTGDVWKVLPILKEYRPDLEITCYDCPPTGLVKVSSLDPHNTALQHHYENIVACYRDMTLCQSELEAYLADCAIQPSIDPKPIA